MLPASERRLRQKDCQNGGKFERFKNILKKSHSIQIAILFTEVRVVMCTFNSKVKNFTLWALLAIEQVDVDKEDRVG